MGKRRYVLLTAALVGITLCGCGEKPVAMAKNSAVLPEMSGISLELDTLVRFPCTPAEDLVVEAFTSYDGAFWEDGSGEEVSGVAALMVANTGTRMIEFGAITVEQGERTLHFFVYDLPPGTRCLVAERLRQPYSEGGARRCTAGVLRWSFPEMSREEVNYVGTDERLTVVNCTARPRNILVRYKRYDPEGAYFLGGMAFSAHFFGVEPQIPKTLIPEHYHAGQAQVVSVSTEE